MKKRKFNIFLLLTIMHLYSISSSNAGEKTEKDDTLTVKYSVEKPINKKIIEDKETLDFECLEQLNLNSFKKIDLISAIEKVICNDSDNKIAWIQTKIHAQNLNIEKSSYYPIITSSLNYSLEKNKYKIESQQAVKNEKNINHNVNLKTSWLLYDFGSRYHRINEAKNLLAMSLALEDSTLQTIILKTITSYYTIVEYEFQKENIKELVQSAEKNYEIANERYKVGVGNKSDQLQLYSNLIKAKSEYKLINGKLKIAKGELGILMGNPSLDDFDVSTQLYTPETLDLEPIKDLIEQAKEDHPRFKALYFSINAAEEKIKTLKRSNYPTISFISDYNNSEQSSQSFSSTQSHQIQAGIQVDIPIFDGFSRKYQIAKAEKDLELKILEREKLEEEISIQIWKNYKEIELTFENIRDLISLKESAEQAYNISQGRYKAGVGNIIEVIYAQNFFNDANMNYLTELKKFINLRYLLLYNIGKL